MRTLLAPERDIAHRVAAPIGRLQWRRRTGQPVSS
jgi:hypothetical protein